jgi:hypothetical protein
VTAASPLFDWNRNSAEFVPSSTANRRVSFTPIAALAEPMASITAVALMVSKNAVFDEANESATSARTSTSSALLEKVPPAVDLTTAPSITASRSPTNSLAMATPSRPCSKSPIVAPATKL